MPRLPEHERSVAIGMLQAGTRVSDVARHFNCHPSTIQRLIDRYQATGTVKDRRRSGQPRITTDVKMAPYVDCIDVFHFDLPPSAPDEQ